MLETKDLTIEIPNKRPLIEKLSMVLQEKDKFAVIGEEGNGKSTLLKVIHNYEDVESYCSVSGEIFKEGLIIGYLEQSLNPEWGGAYVYEFFLKDKPEDEVDYNRFTQFDEVAKVLSKLKIAPKILESEQKMETLSGGEKVKVQIAKLLVKNPDVLLLDEPTNDLDIETLEWLEEFICTQNIPILFVSHDETLLENTANTILHLEQIKSRSQARHTLQKIGYKDYIDERAQKIAKQEQLASMEFREHKKDKQILSRQKSTIRSAQINIKDSAVRRVLNKKMRNILVQEKKAEDKRKTEKPDIEDSIYMFFENEPNIPRGKTVLDLKIPELKIGDKILAKNISLFVSGPTKLAIIGRNGIGKTTLLREIEKSLKERDDISVGYMPQNYDDILDNNMIVMDYLSQGFPEGAVSKIGAYMGRIKLSWEEVNGEIGDLSYGQKAKLMILKMMLIGNNVLLFDEPTRNLSSLSNPVIREILKNYKGAIISISHDRKYLREVCQVIYELDENGLRETNI